jgi:hypothetical protein
MQTIKLNGQTLIVSELSNELQNLVALLENINDNILQANITLGINEAAKIEVSRQIGNAYARSQESTSQEPNIQE